MPLDCLMAVVATLGQVPKTWMKQFCPLLPVEEWVLKFQLYHSYLSPTEVAVGTVLSQTIKS